MEAVAGDPDDKRIAQTYWDVELRKDGIVWLARRPEPYPSIAQVHQAYDDFLKVVDDWLLDRRIKAGQLGTKARTPMAWLTDMRNAPDLRNDREFEAAVKERRPELLERSPAIGVLVKTSAGQMQLNRITRDNRAVMGVFSEPTEVVSWLLARIGELFPQV